MPALGGKGSHAVFETDYVTKKGSLLFLKEKRKKDPPGLRLPLVPQ